MESLPQLGKFKKKKMFVILPGNCFIYILLHIIDYNTFFEIPFTFSIALLLSLSVLY